MIAVLLVIHLFIAIALIAVILLQRSEGGALGIGGGNFGGLMTTRGSSNLLTRATAILAATFMSTSLLLAILAGSTQAPRSIVDQPPPAAPTAPAPAQEPAVPFAR